MNDLNDLSKILEDFNRALESTTKAIAEKPDLIVSFNQAGKDTNDETMYLPQITKKFNQSEVSKVRGVADLKALKIKYHNKRIHSFYKPKSSTAEKIYNIFEQYLGISKFLTSRFCKGETLWDFDLRNVS